MAQPSSKHGTGWLAGPLWKCTGHSVRRGRRAWPTATRMRRVMGLSLSVERAQRRGAGPRRPRRLSSRTVIDRASEDCNTLVTLARIGGAIWFSALRALLQRAPEGALGRLRHPL